MPPMTDADGALFETLRPRLKAISARIVGSDAEAEDVVQDCFLKWISVDRNALATPVAWLTTVVKHQSIDRLRRRERDVVTVEAAAQLASLMPPAMPEEFLLRRIAVAEALAQLLVRLSLSERLALVLHEVFDCDHADIAAVPGTKPVNARQHLARARRRLQEAEAPDAHHEKLNRDLVRRFQLALDGIDLPAMVALLAHEQPFFVPAAPQLQLRAGACANDASYRVARIV